MKVLRPVQPTKEQLAVIANTRSGPFVIRGAAGSGKTTTALYRLKQTVRFWQRRARDGHLQGPVRVLVLTYNRTLRGYIDELAREDIAGTDVSLNISTFGKWAYDALGRPNVLGHEVRELMLATYSSGLNLDKSFIYSEVDYVLGRYLPDSLEDYINSDRKGRGRTPRMPVTVRRRMLDEVIYPYIQWKAKGNLLDWGDVAVQLAAEPPESPFHVVVVDESQDFSANQVRAILQHVDVNHSATFVLDGAQRIYPQRFTWAEVGLEVGPNNSHKLSTNFRNTKQIAAFAAPLLNQVETTDDSVIPDYSSCSEEGDLPVLVAGTFTSQMDYVINFLRGLGEDNEESVAILHAKGWFTETKRRLTEAGLAFVELTANSQWPQQPTSIALSTMHSAKGLEFDHVIILGLNAETMPHGAEPGDSQRDAHLRLLAMAAGRARKTVTVTYKPAEASDVIACFAPNTYTVIQP